MDRKKKCKEGLLLAAMFYAGSDSLQTVYRKSRVEKVYNT